MEAHLKNAIHASFVRQLGGRRISCESVETPIVQGKSRSREGSSSRSRACVWGRIARTQNCQLTAFQLGGILFALLSVNSKVCSVITMSRV